MIRITQTYINNLSVDYFINQGWEILYSDLPGGRRSGVGRVAEINKLWEGLYNLSPDILVIKDGILLLLEVDKIFTREYEMKLLKYHSKKGELINKLEIILATKITDLRYGFVSHSKRVPKITNPELFPFHFLCYLDEKLTELIISF